MTCLLFWDHLDTLLAEKNFSLDLCAFVILENLTFCCFLVVVCKILSFHDLALSIFKKFSCVVLVGTSCFDEVSLAEIVYS